MINSKGLDVVFVYWMMTITEDGGNFEGNQSFLEDCYRPQDKRTF
jgi:hypothetical protein